MSKPSKRVAVVAASATVLISITGVVALNRSSAEQDNDQQTVNDSSGVIQCGDGPCTVTQNLDDPDKTDEEVRTELAAIEARQEEPPYAFVVLAGPDGLIIRNDPGRDGVQIGAASNRATVFAQCAITNDFDPDLKGPRWLKVHWPTDTPNRNFDKSQPSDPVQGWAYAAYLAPVGDVAIPDC